MTEKQSPGLEISGSRQFTAWLDEQKTSLAFTTYQAGKLFLIGLKQDGRLSVFERTFNRCMGLIVEDNTLYMSSLYQLWRFENLLQPGGLYQDYDRLFVPQVSWVTGDLDIHDLVITANKELQFVNTLFSCVSKVSEQYSFEPVWVPNFISKLAAEDRCHLNGLAARDGKARYASAISRSDITEGWRDRRRDGGIVIDIDSNEVVCDGLSMPHSVRWYRDTLYVLNSGAGYFGKIDTDTGKFEAICFCPGYARGLNFIGNFALIGLSKSRNKSFTGLSLDDELKKRDGQSRCGIIVVDLRSGDIVHSLNIEGVVDEIYDVVALPGVSRPSAIGTVSDEIRRIISIPPD